MVKVTRTHTPTVEIISDFQFFAAYDFVETIEHDDESFEVYALDGQLFPHRVATEGFCYEKNARHFAETMCEIYNWKNESPEDILF